MAELRQDKLTKEWVTIAEERANRPTSFDPALVHGAGGASADVERGACPFCPGSGLTQESVYESEDGAVRIVPNLYPALTLTSPQGYGAHEVVIDTPDHSKQLIDFSPAEIKTVLDSIRQRMIHYNKDPRIQYVQVFKNSGPKAGASIAHSHWQLLAMPLATEKLKTIWRNTGQYWAEGCCPICDMGRYRQPELLVYENANAMLYAPYASKYQYTLQIAPKEHCPGLTSATDECVRDMADALLAALRALRGVFENLPYNITLIDGGNPNLWANRRRHHMYWEIIPRMGGFGGLELSTGCYINPVYPEKAADNLRNRLTRTN